MTFHILDEAVRKRKIALESCRLEMLERLQDALQQICPGSGVDKVWICAGFFGI